MVFGDELFVRGQIVSPYRTPPDLIVPGISTPPLHSDEMVGLEYLIVADRLVVRPYLAVKILVVELEVDLERFGRVITDLQIDVVVRECCTTCEGNTPVDIGKNIKTVPPSLRDRKWRVKSHPV